MSISSQLPVVFHAQAGSLLRGMALVPGQTVEARALHQNGNGATQVQIGRQSVALNLPQSVPPGSLLTLAVQQADGQMRLALVSARPPATMQVLQPATTIQISQGAASAPPQTSVTAYGPPAAAVPLSASVAGAAGAAGAAAAASPATSGSLGATAGQQGVSGVAGAAPVASATGGRPPATPYTPTVQSSGAGAAQPVLAQMVQQALPGQNSLSGVTSLLTVLVARAGVPEPVLKAARQVLSNQLELGGKPNAAMLKSAIGNSGLFQEAALAAGRPAAAAGDTKSGLLALRQGLAQWLGGEAQVSQIARVPPPVRGMVPRARLSEPLPVDLPLDVEETGRLLLERTDGALSRLRLHQNASLPELSHRSEAQWNLDLPIAVAGYQTILQMQIHRDAHTEGDQPENHSWQVRFALNLPDMGEVGAQVSLRGTLIGVLLWAEREVIATALAAQVESLRDDLTGAGLLAGAIVVRSGAPADPTGDGVSGHMVDAFR